MSAEVTDLLDERAAFSLHDSTTAVGDLEFRTGATRWGYAVSLPVMIPDASDPARQPVIVIELQVVEGSIGVGVLDETLQRFVSTEVDTSATGRPARIELRVEESASRAHVIVRNTAAEGTRSQVKILGLRLQLAAAHRALLEPVTAPEIASTVHGAPPITGVFDVLISHSSRRWFAEQCDRNYLRERYVAADRLRDLPPFESLPPNRAPYHGLLTVFRIGLSETGITSRVLQHYVSAEKIMHAASVGDQVVVCFDAGVATFSRRRDADSVGVVPDSGERIADPWFGGLHTVIPVDGRTCLLSSAGADAALWLDIVGKEVTRRWRLPSTRYGANYVLGESTWLAEHYISNDKQLGHVNCAAPDGRGGAFISVLGQGDIGHVDPSGGYELIASGYVGCHGVRYDVNAGLLYFCDSCGGTLMQVEGTAVNTLVDTGSRWLHDGVHLAGGLFLLTLGDRNCLALADAGHGRVVAEWDFSGTGGTIQFLTAAGVSLG